MRTVGERPWRGSVTVPFMWTAASRWAAGRVLVGPVGSEAVVLGGGGGGGGGGGASRFLATWGAPHRPAPRVRGPALCMSLVWARGCNARGRRQAAAVSDRGQAWLSQEKPLPRHA